MPRAFFLVGPTAVGKSAAAHYLARRRRTAILSADSMQVYRELDLGTAKPSAAERAEVDYAGIDLVDPDQTFSAGDYLRQARQAFATRPDSLLVTGGTGLYIKCLTEGLRQRPPPDPQLRQQLEELYRRDGAAALREELRARDPARLQTLADPANPRRLIRAIELAAAGLACEPAPPKHNAPPLVGLWMKAERLAEKIRQRVDQMFAAGLIEEARQVRRRHPRLSDTARHAIGYAEAWAVLDGRLDEAAARELMARRTRQLARRQMTWFRHQARVDWIEVAPGADLSEIAARVSERWEQHGPTPVNF